MERDKLWAIVMCVGAIAGLGISLQVYSYILDLVSNIMSVNETSPFYLDTASMIMPAFSMLTGLIGLVLVLTVLKSTGLMDSLVGKKGGKGGLLG